MEECQHYWVIPNTRDGRCQGVCRKCEASKEFLNRMPGNDDRESPVLQTVRMVTRGRYIPEIVAE